MKTAARFRAALPGLLLLLTFAIGGMMFDVQPVYAQGPSSPELISKFAGRFNARQYGTWQTRILNTITSGAQTIQLADSFVAVGGGRSIVPFATNIRLQTLDGSSAETVTPTAVSNCTVGNQSPCSVTATFANAHSAGVSVISGSFGLDEAIADALSQGGGDVVLDAQWGGTNAIIAAVPTGLQTSNVVLEDQRVGYPAFLAIRPSAVTLIAAPAAPTVAVNGAGTLTSGAYRVMAAYVDVNGGVSLASTDSAQTATTTGLTITSPVATAGAVGWLPYITAAGGGTGTEILAKAAIDSTICALTNRESIVPACAIGAAASVAVANPSATAKPMVEGNAFTLAAYQPFGNSVPPTFTSNFPFGVFVATATLNASAADGAQFQTPAGFFNFLGKSWDICVKGATATQVASSTLTVNITAASQYAQSPVTVSTMAFPTQTQAAAGTFEGCVRLMTSTTGSSGKFWATSPSGPWVDFLNSAPATQVVTADASAAASSAIDLTKQLWWAVNIQAASANNITGPIINSVSILPVQ